MSFLQNNPSEPGSSPSQQDIDAYSRFASTTTVAETLRHLPSVEFPLASSTTVNGDLESSLSVDRDAPPVPDLNAALEKYQEKGITKGEPEEAVCIVDWDGPDDPENPKNWTYRKKMITTCLVSAMTFLTPLSSAMMAPAGDLIAEEFHISNPLVVASVTSIFVLAYAFGPLLLGPLSEIYGRTRVSTGANIVYFAFNLACGFSRNTAQLIAFRFMSGFGGSAPFAVSGGVLGDIWKAEERGTANGLYTLGAVLGTGIGPLVGAWIAERTSWRWVFFSTSIADGFVLLLFYVFLDESYEPIILARRAVKVRVERGIEKHDMKLVRTRFQSLDWRWGPFFWNAIIRPFALFIHEPIIQVIGAYMAFAYGLVYLVLTIIPNIFLQVRHQTLGISGLHYIAHGLGAVTAAYINMRTLDPLYKYFSKRNGGIGEPEFRLPFMVVGTILLPIGMLIIGWTARPNIPWIATDIGLALVAGATDFNFQPMQTYIIDAFTLHAASALAAVTFFRSIAGFGFPLFAPAMFNGLGYGMGSTILAIAAVILGCPTPFLLWRYGKFIRAKSSYAVAD